MPTTRSAAERKTLKELSDQDQKKADKRARRRVKKERYRLRKKQKSKAAAAAAAQKDASDNHAEMDLTGEHDTGRSQSDPETQLSLPTASRQAGSENNGCGGVQEGGGSVGVSEADKQDVVADNASDASDSDLTELCSLLVEEPTEDKEKGDEDTKEEGSGEKGSGEEDGSEEDSMVTPQMMTRSQARLRH